MTQFTSQITANHICITANTRITDYEKREKEMAGGKTSSWVSCVILLFVIPLIIGERFGAFCIFLWFLLMVKITDHQDREQKRFREQIRLWKILRADVQDIGLTNDHIRQFTALEVEVSK